MIDWFNNLTLEYQIFYGIGILALAVVVVQMLMTLIGFDHDGGFDVDIGEMDHGSGVGLFSSQTLGAFFLAFGWVGVAALKNGASVLFSSAIAIVCGLLAMIAMLVLLRSLLKLQSKGNLDYSSVIGQEGTVYVTIPGGDADGGGQIQINIQGRYTTASARKVSLGALKPGERVRVVGVNGPASFVVEDV
jgi:membrane protein implicated in regulation of membrane protease activity